MSRVERPFSLHVTPEHVTIQISVSRDFIEQVKVLDEDPVALLDSVLRDGYRDMIEKAITMTEPLSIPEHRNDDREATIKNTTPYFDEYHEKSLSETESLRRFGIDITKE